MTGLSIANGRLAGGFALAIDGKRIERIIFEIRRGIASIEDVVRRKMDQWQAPLPAKFGDHPRGLGIHRHRLFGLGLGTVDGSIGRCIDHQIIGLRHQSLAERRCVKKVEVVAVKGHCVEVPVSGYPAKGLSHLPSRTQYEPTHSI